jgi:hypothetical protein
MSLGSSGVALGLASAALVAVIRYAAAALTSHPLAELQGSPRCTTLRVGVMRQRGTDGRGTGRGHAACAALVSILSAASAAGAAPGGPVHVAQPAAVCLDQPAVERALFSRIRRPRGSGGPDDTDVRIRIEADGATFVGRVTIVEPGEPPRERVVRGSTCDEVALSLLLAASLALSGEPEADPNRPPAEGGTLDGADTGDRAAAPRPTPVPPPSTFTPVLGTHVAVAAAGRGAVARGADVFGELSSMRSGWSPGLRLALAYGAADRSAGGVTVDVSTLTVRVEPSLVRVAAGPVAARLVISIEGGAAFATTYGAARAESATRPWLRAGPQAELAVGVLGPVGLEVSGGVLVAVVRDDFVVEPSGFGLRVPRFGAVARLGGFVRFR